MNRSCKEEKNKVNISHDQQIRLLKQEITRQNSIIKSLHETTIGLLNRRRIDDLLKAILKRAAQLAKTPHGYIYLWDSINNTMEMKIGMGMYEASRVYNLRKGEGFGGRVWRTGKPMTLTDYATWDHRLDGKQWDSTHALIGAPLKSDNDVVGIIVLASSDPARRFTSYEVAQLGKFAELASVVLENARLYEALEKELAERRRAEAELYLSTERLRAVIESAKDYIYVKDGELKYKDINPAMAGLFAMPVEEIAGKSDFDLFAPEIAEKLQETDRLVLVGKNVDDSELHISINGKERILNRIKVPLREKGGSIIGICGIIRDITERKRVECEIIEAREAVAKAQRVASLGAMAAGITHEINQPLNSIKVTASGLLYLYLKGEIHDLGEMMEDIRDICDNADRIGEIIRHMRAFIQHRNKFPEITELKPCNLVKAVDLALNLIYAQLNAHGITLRKVIHASELYVNATMTGLEGIIINILVNAMEALDGVGIASKEITIAVFAQDKAVFLEISDNGPGISEDIKANLFEPFFTTKADEENIGLGLSIIQAFVKSFNGKISVNGGEYGGTKMTVELPRYCEGN